MISVAPAIVTVLQKIEGDNAELFSLDALIEMSAFEQIGEDSVELQTMLDTTTRLVQSVTVTNEIAKGLARVFFRLSCRIGRPILWLGSHTDAIAAIAQRFAPVLEKTIESVNGYQELVDQEAITDLGWALVNTALANVRRGSMASNTKIMTKVLALSERFHDHALAGDICITAIHNTVPYPLHPKQLSLAYRAVAKARPLVVSGAPIDGSVNYLAMIWRTFVTCLKSNRRAAFREQFLTFLETAPFLVNEVHVRQYIDGMMDEVSDLLLAATNKREIGPFVDGVEKHLIQHPENVLARFIWICAAPMIISYVAERSDAALVVKRASEFCKEHKDLEGFPGGYADSGVSFWLRFYFERAGDIEVSRVSDVPMTKFQFTREREGGALDVEIVDDDGKRIYHNTIKLFSFTDAVAPTQDDSWNPPESWKRARRMPVRFRA
jgi:hypothetical protein